jgi:peptide chain release factor subunit 1
MVALHEIDLRRLSRMSAPDRVFLSVYLGGREAERWLPGRLRRARELLLGSANELEHFDESRRLLETHLRQHGYRAPRCVFVCWAIDLAEGYELPVPVKNRLVVDSSPFVRPLAELQDEYEDYAVVVADNRGARIYLVASAVAQDESRVRANVKNHVKVGGWSQQRYERRRDKQIRLYAREVAERLSALDQEARFRRVILAGGREAVTEIRRSLPPAIATKAVGELHVHLGGNNDVEQELLQVFEEQERESERALWNRIKGEHLRSGLAAAGSEDVLGAAGAGRIDTLIVTRNQAIPGVRCRSCERLTLDRPAACPACRGLELFDVDVVNELVELVKSSSGEVEFVDPIPGLTEVGGVAALLRY